MIEQLDGYLAPSRVNPPQSSKRFAVAVLDTEAHVLSEYCFHPIPFLVERKLINSEGYLTVHLSLHLRVSGVSVVLGIL